MTFALIAALVVGDTLPPIPATMPSALGPAPVVLVDSFPGEPGLLAKVDFVTRRVSIRRDLSREGQWQAYWHESVHLTLFDATASIPDEYEERVADAIANQRVREMLDRRR